jgi:serine/threonine protein kinase
MRPIRMSQNPVRMERVKREVTILKQVSHPNIVRLHDVFESYDTLVIVMELVRGKVRMSCL